MMQKNYNLEDEDGEGASFAQKKVNVKVMTKKTK